jgi:hypothetical protein
MKPRKHWSKVSKEICDFQSSKWNNLSVRFEDVTGVMLNTWLNRSGRHLIQDPQVQQSLWAEILSRTQEHKGQDGTPDVLYYFLREKPELLNLSCR